VDPPEQPGDWLDSHSGRTLPSPLGRAVVLALVAAAIVVAAVWVTMRAADDRRAEAEWPGGCGVDGNKHWCARPSGAMTAGSLTSVVRAWCPRLADTAPADLVPQPLALAELGGGASLASTDGNRSRGREDALLGRRTEFSWVTRWVGGPSDGQVEIRCPGSTHVVSGLRLSAGQLRSTVAARTGARSPYVDFVKVAHAALAEANPRHDLSFGSLACDTSPVDLVDPQPRRRFTCQWDGYGPPGKTVLTAEFEITATSPYFRRAPDA
jgi:hypothetical protein